MAEEKDTQAPHKIIHVDMDAFFASVEQRDDPHIRGKPVAVGGSSKRGVVAAASYEARVFGVHSAMSSVVAARKCPDLIFVKPRFDVYASVSRQIRDIFLTYTPLVEPLSLDEAYLDVTDALRGPASATLIARDIKAEIKSATELTASAGVSYNKFLAKIASGMNKPDGLTVIKPENALEFIGSLAIERFYGVGAATARRFRALGITNGAELKNFSEADLVRHLGKAGRYYYSVARGVDKRSVRPDRVRKSIGAERTFFEDVSTEDELQRRLDEVLARVSERIERAGASGRTVTLKIKYHDFVIKTRRRTLASPVETADELRAVASDLMRVPSLPERPVRLLGVSLSNLVGDEVGPSQLELNI